MSRIKDLLEKNRRKGMVTIQMRSSEEDRERFKRWAKEEGCTQVALFSAMLDLYKEEKEREDVERSV